MTSSVRAIGLRIALLCGLVSSTALLAASHVPGPTQLPFALLDAFDEAFAAVYDVAEREVIRFEAARPRPLAGPDVVAMLREVERIVSADCEAAATALDVELAVAGSLSLERRNAALGCLERHLREARKAASHACDPGERAEYALTCERLRRVRHALQLA